MGFLWWIATLLALINYYGQSAETLRGYMYIYFFLIFRGSGFEKCVVDAVWMLFFFVLTPFSTVIDCVSDCRAEKFSATHRWKALCVHFIVCAVVTIRPLLVLDDFDDFFLVLIAVLLHVSQLNRGDFVSERQILCRCNATI